MLDVVFPFGYGQVNRRIKIMDFFKKVFAESDPAEEQPEDDKTNDEDEFTFVEGPPPGDDCDCICFCQEKDDGSGKLDCKCFCFCDEEEEEELSDPQDELREKCTERKDCQGYKEKLEECSARVEGKSKTSENCVEELIDFMHCVDHCVSKSLFKKLK